MSAHRPALPSLLVGISLVALVALSGCGSSVAPAHSSRWAKAIAACRPATAEAQVTVDATNSFRFRPAAVCLQLGGTVVWKNITSGLDHTSTDEPSVAASASDASLPAKARGWNLRLPAGSSARRKFTEVGVYRYFCIPHETLGMLGVVIVVRAH
ncbi:MAG TPA: plastocyanin/azurin family copper-binding protein [Candidatus Dormibacteraeota bacterium]